MIRIGFLGVAHMHAYGYAHGLTGRTDATLVGVFDADPNKASEFASKFNLPQLASADALLTEVDAVIITSENVHHASLGLQAAAAGKAILCEKPLVTKDEEGLELIRAAKSAGVPLMTAFPCRYAPAYQRLRQRVQNGDLGAIQAICATNRGTCPWGWFVDPSLSGGGAMIDHVVHLTDLIRDLMSAEVTSVQAQIGNQMYQREWDDTAMLTLEFSNGVFATLDSSWSRPASYKTWGDVTMNVVGDRAVAEVDLFGQEIDFYRSGEKTHVVSGFGSDCDAGLVADFIRCVKTSEEPPVTGWDGLQATRVALAGYESVKTGQPVAPLATAV